MRRHLSLLLAAVLLGSGATACTAVDYLPKDGEAGTPLADAVVWTDTAAGTPDAGTASETTPADITVAKPDAEVAQPDVAQPPDEGTAPSDTSGHDAAGADASANPDGTTGTDGGGPGADVTEPPDPCEGVHPGVAPMRLMTRAEYDYAVLDLLGDATAPASTTLPPENEALGFSNNADAHQASPLLVEKLLVVAEDVAARAVAERLGVIAPCAVSAGAEVNACRDAWLSTFAVRLFRRPLSDDEADAIATVFDEGVADGGITSGVEWALQSMLMSPQFLYRVRALSPGESVGAPVALGPYELASRLSFLLWASVPDDLLMEAADDGVLASADGLESEARRMLGDPRAARVLDEFHTQWLGLEDLQSIARDLPPDSTLDPSVVAAGWRDSLLTFARETLSQAGGMQLFFTSPTVYLNEALASLYSLEVGQVDLPETERAGLLTQPAMMALLAHPDQSSPIKRGVFVRRRIMCEHLDDPPPEVVVNPPVLDPDATTRERFAQHTADPTCASCHYKIDPIGFGFERYDALGRYRLEENGLPIDASGAVMAPAADFGLAGAFDDAVELSHRLSDSHQVTDCLTSEWFTYAMGRSAIDAADTCNLTRVQDAFESSDGDIRELLVALVRSDAFRLRPGATLVAAPELPPEPEIPDPPDPENPTEPVDPGTVGQTEPTSPTGFFDSISPSGVASGWALDANAPLYPLFVEVWVDGTQIEPRQRADKPRPDVNEVTGWGGDHGFKFLLPAAARDGQPHEIRLVAQDVGDSPHKNLNNSPKTFQLGQGVSTLPKLTVDAVSATGHVHGWAYDPDDPPPNVTVHFCLDAPCYLGGTHLGTAPTGTAPRPDVDAAFNLTTPAQAGWSFQLPASALDGQQHKLYAEADDLTISGMRRFANPKTFTASLANGGGE